MADNDPLQPGQQQQPTQPQAFPQQAPGEGQQWPQQPPQGSPQWQQSTQGSQQWQQPQQQWPPQEHQQGYQTQPQYQAPTQFQQQPPIPYPQAQQNPNYPQPQQSSGSDGTLGGLIPYKNSAALAAYYIGVFSILCPIIGIAALVLGIIGLRQANERPEIKGKAHAWVGIIAGGFFTLLSAGLLVLAIIGMASASR